jgi:agmatinase
MSPKDQPQFLGIASRDADYRQSKFVVIPCPHELTTSYGKGTKKGPAAILNASRQVEWFDYELGCETYPQKRIYTLKSTPIGRLGSTVKRVMADDKIPVILGGEHSITPQAVKAAAEKYRGLSVLQLDAHADLRDQYQGRKDSHACALRRVLEICPAVQVGIRTLSAEEWEWARGNGQIDKIHFADKLELVDKIENQLSKKVYITIDVDVFDPSVIPATGTPEPGGMLWYEVLDILKGVCDTKQIVGCDVVELSPRPGDIASAFTIAKLVYKIMGFLKTK